MGGIGQQVAKRCKALGMTVLGVKRRVDEVENVDEVHALADLDAIVGRADHIVLTLPGTAQTEKLINAHLLGLAKPGVTVVNDMPDDVVRAFKPDRRTCVVALTHDPKLDDLALLEALSTDAFYVGGIGSRRNNQARRARMIEHFDQTEEGLLRLRGPIGIYIGSKTPPEIAVSVMAEVLAVKNGVTLPRDMEVAQAKNVREWPQGETDGLVRGVRAA